MTLTIKKKIYDNYTELSELDSFSGKDVIITITEEVIDNFQTENLGEFFKLAGNISIDETAIYKLRELSTI